MLTFGGIPYLPYHCLADVCDLLIHSFHDVTGKLMPTVVLEQQHTRIDEAERMTGSAWSKEARRSCTL